LILAEAAFPYSFPQFSDQLCVIVVCLDDLGVATDLGRSTLNQVWSQCPWGWSIQTFL